MHTFDETVNKLRWSGLSLDDVTVGAFDRVQAAVVELPLREFLGAEIPHHRARYLRRGDDRFWDRGSPNQPAPVASMHGTSRRKQHRTAG